MTFFDDSFSNPPPKDLDAHSIVSPPSQSPVSHPDPLPLAGDPLSYVVQAPVPYSQRTDVPEDLRISWSWVHLLCFVLFAFGVLAILPLIFAIPYLQGKHIPPQELEHFLNSTPQFVVGSTLVSLAAIVFFLYITLSVLPGQPFWRSLGWRKLTATASGLPSKAWIYFLCGCGLSLIAAFVGSRVHTPDDMPIEQLLKSRTGAMLMMAMAVAIAPLVEETLFRGYLYPVLVRIFSTILGFCGVEFSRSIRAGVATSILVTGILFGLLHGAQLAWTWRIVALLIFVGMTFTYVRARTGTVVASYFMHLGYNSLIAFATIASTHGFSKLPLHP